MGPRMVKFVLLTGMLLEMSLQAQQQPPAPVGGQVPTLPQAGQATPGQPIPGQATPPQNEPGTMEQVRSNYVLGPNDQILIRAFGAEEIGERPYHIDSDGNVDLPLVGTIKAGGLSVDQLEAELTKRLATYIRNPQVSVTVVQYRSEPVFFVGAFAHPGIYPLQGRRTLVDMLASIGGLQPNASRRITIIRSLEYGPIPLPNAVVNKATNTSTVEIGMGSLRDNLNPADDILLQPYDQIQVSRAEMVYVGGEVNHVTGVQLEERDSLSVIQVLSMAGGLTRDADAEKARVLRPVLNTSKRAEIPINIKLVLEGKNSDFPLMPNDLLYVPRKRSVGGTVAHYLPYVIAPLITTIIYLSVR
jgi:polysaccharide biosynthesis/export protein